MTLQRNVQRKVELKPGIYYYSLMDLNKMAKVALMFWVQINTYNSWFTFSFKTCVNTLQAWRQTMFASQTLRWEKERQLFYSTSEEDKSRLVSPCLPSFHYCFHEDAGEGAAVCSTPWSPATSAALGCEHLHPARRTGGNQDKSRDRDCKYSCSLWINGYLWVSGFPAEMPPLSPPAGRAVWSMGFTVEISKRSWIIEGDQKLDARC